MNGTTAKSPQKDSMAKPALILLAITAITALLLGFVNMVTWEKIEEIKLQKQQDAMTAVVNGAASFDEEASTVSGISDKHEVYSAFDSSGNVIGYAIQVYPNGFGGTIEMMVGMQDGVVSGVRIVSMSETAGLGTKVNTEEWFLKQFTGADGQLTVKQDIDAISGATVTSSAVTAGVNTALGVAAELYEGGTAE